ncbi:MAG: NnrU family protein [Gammaproteobacteria bacterium]|nr:NnrU family protein [Gammaproteobacteria bacterium]
MDAALWVTGLAGAAFFVSHLGLAHPPVHDRIVGRIGEKGFQGVYLLATLVTLGGMIAGYVYAPHYIYLWIPGPGVRHLPLLIMPLAFILIAGGVLTPNPSALGMEGNLDRADAARSVLRITRHPVMWGLTLWAAVHVIANGDLASLLFFSGFLLTALLGSLHLDWRMATTEGDRWQRFAAVTSYVPFAAILSGRQTWNWAELGRPAAWGLGGFVVLLLLHPYLFGVRPY